MMEKRKPILVLDFDGVLHSYKSGWQGADVIPDPPVPGAIEFLYEAINHFEVHIFSSRSLQKGGIPAMARWLAEHEEIWRQQQRLVPRTSLMLNIEFPREKPPAHVTLDDRAITFKGEWPEVESLLSFKPWYKHD